MSDTCWNPEHAEGMWNLVLFDNGPTCDCETCDRIRTRELRNLLRIVRVSAACGDTGRRPKRRTFGYRGAGKNTVRRFNRRFTRCPAFLIPKRGRKAKGMPRALRVERCRLSLSGLLNAATNRWYGPGPEACERAFPALARRDYWYA